MVDETATRRPGRPRDPQVQDAILRAAHDRLADDGYARLTIAQVAADAGVTKPTVYRRWADKDELVADAIRYAFRRRRDEVAAAVSADDVDDGSSREALAAAVHLLFGRSADGVGARIAVAVMAEADRTPAVLETFRTEAVAPRTELLLDLLRTLQDRGVVRADADLRPVVELLLGGYLAAYLVDGPPGGPDDDRARADAFVAALWPHLVIE